MCLSEHLIDVNIAALRFVLTEGTMNRLPMWAATVLSRELVIMPTLLF